MIRIKDRKILSRLENKGLIIKIDRGKYRIYHPLFKEFLGNKAIYRDSNKPLDSYRRSEI